MRKISKLKLCTSIFITMLHELLKLTPFRNAIFRLTSKVTVNKNTIAHIPVLEYFKPDNQTKKLVFLQHGFLGNKSRVANFAYRLANAGYYVVCPDAYGHGERKETDFLTVVEIAVKTAGDYNQLIEYYKNQPLVDTVRFAIAGESMGGIIAYYYAVHGKYRPVVIAPCISTPDTEQLVNYELGLCRYNRGTKKIIDDEHAIASANKYMKDQSLFLHLDKFSDCAIIIQNSILDPLIDSNDSIRFYQLLKPIIPNEKLEYHRVRAFFHYVPNCAIRNVIRFLGDNL